MTEVDSELRNSEPSLPIELPLDGHAGPAARLSRERAAAFVATALADLEPWSTGTRQVSPSARPRHWLPWVAAAGTVLTLVGSAAAARYYFDFSEKPKPALAPPPASVDAAAKGHRASTVASNTPEPELAVVEDAPPVKAEKPTRNSARSAPEDLLQRANQQRTAAQFKEAAQTYALVYERFPRTLSAYVARVAGAAIELEHLQNAKRARSLFEQALRERPNGALDLEARQGLLLSLRDLGDRASERRALTSLIAAHAGSPAARRAELRLRELDKE